MALQKTITYKNGTSANYWRILRINNLVSKTSEVFIAGYVSKDIRDENPEAYLDMKSKFIEIPKELFINGNVFEFIYEEIVKSKPQEKITPASVDADGNEIPESKKTIETNEFFGSLTI